MTNRTSWTVSLVLLVALGCSSGGSSKDASTNDGAADTTGGLPGFGQSCAPAAQQGDPQCAAGLVCVAVGAEQGRNLCTKTCTTEGAACAGAPAGTAPTCGREYQLSPANSRVCEFFCDPAAPNCPPSTTCLADFEGMMVCQPPVM
jgi:hypothetical protein